MQKKEREGRSGENSLRARKRERSARPSTERAGKGKASCICIGKKKGRAKGSAQPNGPAFLAVQEKLGRREEVMLGKPPKRGGGEAWKLTPVSPSTWYASSGKRRERGNHFAQQLEKGRKRVDISFF